MTTCRTTYVPCGGIRSRLAADVDRAVARLAGGGELVGVTIAPIAAGESDGESPTAGVLVTILVSEV